MLKQIERKSGQNLSGRTKGVSSGALLWTQMYMGVSDEWIDTCIPQGECGRRKLNGTLTGGYLKSLRRDIYRSVVRLRDWWQW